MKALAAYATLILYPLLAAATQEPGDPVLGIVKQSSGIGVLDMQTCGIKPGPMPVPLADGDSIVVFGLQTCNHRLFGLLGLRNEFYQVAVAGQIMHARKTAITGSTEGLRQVDDMPEKEKEVLKLWAVTESLKLRKAEFSEMLAAVMDTQAKGIALISYSMFDVSSRTRGTGFRFKVYNPTHLTIKSVTARIRALDAGMQPVHSPDGTSRVALRGAGPIAPEGIDSFSWDNVWRSDLPERLQWISLDVEYVDGTIQVIENPKEVLLLPKHVRILESVYKKQQQQAR